MTLTEMAVRWSSGSPLDPELARTVRQKIVAAKVTDPRFARLAYMDASAAVTEDTDFETALGTVLEDNPDYLPSEDDDDEETPPSRASTGKPVESGKPGKTDKNYDAFEKGIEENAPSSDSREDAPKED